MKETGYYLRDACTETKKEFIPKRRESIESMIDILCMGLMIDNIIRDEECISQGKVAIDSLLANYGPYVNGDTYFEY